jgi:hypothetical protein
MCSPSSRSGSTERGTVLHLGVPKCTKSSGSPYNLLLEHFFDLPDLFLNFAGVFFGVAFGL